jgi:hypothetical protein
MKTHPIQPTEIDGHGVLRFKRNAIVDYLLDNGGIDMNDIARLDFSREDREQFAQLIGYSVSGFSDLSYASDLTYSTAVKMHEFEETQEQAEVAALKETLEAIKSGLRTVAAAAFQIHPDDLV